MDAIQVSSGIVISKNILTLILRVKLDTAGGCSQSSKERSSSSKVLHVG
jgi:hypothetical protein